MFLECMLTQHLCVTRKIDNVASSKQALSKYSAPEKCLLSSLGRCLVLSHFALNFSVWFP